MLVICKLGCEILHRKVTKYAPSQFAVLSWTQQVKHDLGPFLLAVELVNEVRTLHVDHAVQTRDQVPHVDFQHCVLLLLLLLH